MKTATPVSYTVTSKPPTFCLTTTLKLRYAFGELDVDILLGTEGVCKPSFAFLMINFLFSWFAARSEISII
jgi:hypothetical protein